MPLSPDTLDRVARYMPMTDEEVAALEERSKYHYFCALTPALAAVSAFILAAGNGEMQLAEVVLLTLGFCLSEMYAHRKFFSPWREAAALRRATVKATSHDLERVADLLAREPGLRAAVGAWSIPVDSFRKIEVDVILAAAEPSAHTQATERVRTLTASAAAA